MKFQFKAVPCPVHCPLMATRILLILPPHPSCRSRIKHRICCRRPRLQCSVMEAASDTFKRTVLQASIDLRRDHQTSYELSHPEWKFQILNFMISKFFLSLCLRSSATILTVDAASSYSQMNGIRQSGHLYWILRWTLSFWGLPWGSQCWAAVSTTWEDMVVYLKTWWGCLGSVGFLSIT